MNVKPQTKGTIMQFKPLEDFLFEADQSVKKGEWNKMNMILVSLAEKLLKIHLTTAMQNPLQIQCLLII